MFTTQIIGILKRAKKTRGEIVNKMVHEIVLQTEECVS